MTLGASVGRVRLDVGVVALGGTIFALAAIESIRSYAIGLGVPFFDWTFYAGAVDRWLAGGNIYPGARISSLGSAAGSSYAYPPASVPLMLPFASWPAGAILWETLIVGILLLGIWAVVRIGWQERPLIVFGLVLASMSLLDGILQGVALGNVNIATAGALGMAWAATRGMPPLIGALGVVKIFPLALAAPLGRAVIIKVAIVVGTICLITLPMVGVSSWSDYVTGLQASQPLCGDPNWVNLSLACGVSPYVGMLIGKWVGLAISFVLVVLAVRAGPGFIGSALVAGAILAPATELHAHYFAIIFVLVLIGLAELNMARSRRLLSRTPLAC